MRNIALLGSPLVMQDDYLDSLISGGGGGGGYDRLGRVIGALQEIGALQAIGEDGIRAEVNSGRITVPQLEAKLAQMQRGTGGPLPSPPFADSVRSTQRRAPMGFVEDGTNANFFSLAAVLGDTTTMRSKVSRVAHLNRMLIVPSATGVVIESLKIGDIEQVLSSGCPVELYGPSALTDSEPDNFSPLREGIDVSITLKNTTAGAITGTIGAKASVQR